MLTVSVVIFERKKTFEKKKTCFGGSGDLRSSEIFGSAIRFSIENHHFVKENNVKCIRNAKKIRLRRQKPQKQGYNSLVKV